MVNKRIVAAVTGLALLTSLGLSQAVQAAPREALPTVALLHAPNLDLARGEASAIRTTGSNNLTYHNGPIMGATVTVRPVYWGPSWSNSTWAADKATGLSAFYSQYGGSNYSAISSQYSQLGGAKTTKNVVLGASVQDLSTASQVTTDVLTKVVSAIGFANLTNDGYYPVYTDLARGNAGFCAWHSAGSVTSGGVTKTIKFAFFFNLEGDPGCDPADARTTYTQGTEAVVNVTAHELAEAMTDPQLNAWFDKQGYENGDKCAWKFNPANSGTVLLQPTAPYAWRIQGEWDNATASCKW